MHRIVPIVVMFLLAGCTTTRQLTVSTDPPDSLIRIDGIDKGQGKLTDKLIFSDKAPTHTVAVSRLGYQEQDLTLRKDFKPNDLHIDLEHPTRRVAITVEPVAAMISVDGHAITSEPRQSIAADVEFTVDSQDRWIPHTITAQRPGYQIARQVIKWDDSSSQYALQLEPRTKDLTITTSPPGAQIYLDNQPVGASPVTINARPFPVDPETGKGIPQQIKAVKNGYPPVQANIGWDDGKTDYSIKILPLSKTIHIVTDPPGGKVMIDGKELPRDNLGASSATLSFPPINDKGQLPTYTATISKKTADSEWYPRNLIIAWDDGRDDYPVKLKEILTRSVRLLEPAFERTDEGWQVIPKTIETLAWKDVSEGDKQPPVQLTRLPAGTQIDTLAVSPDGANVLFTTLSGSDASDFCSQILMIRSDGSGGAQYLSDGKSLELTPSFTPGGDKIVFSSNRAGKRLSLWQMSASGAPGIEQLTTGDTNDLWPTIDSDPKPRLYYQALVDTRPDPRLYMTALGTVTRTDLTVQGGTQPRVSPKNDQIVFCAINPKTGKRDLYLMSASGGSPQDLTNTPDVDEFDPVFSKDGSHLAFVSDAGVDSQRRHNYDIWDMDLAHADRPAQITTNGSWDDHPAWDPTGAAIYFRSNRGGEWGIWKISMK